MSNLKIDEDEVSRIVETMKRKYREEGIVVEDVDSSLKEIRGIIADNSYSKIDLENEEDLELFGSDLSKKMGNVYLKFKKILKPIQKMLKDFPLNEEIGYYLYSANMRYSANQYLALASAGGFVIALTTIIIVFFIGLLLQDLLFTAIVPITIGIFAWIISTIIILTIPKQRAIARGAKISSELPFALRHMATELKAGIGLYKTIQAIAINDYGILSEEFSKTINEIEEGADTTTALKHTSLRTQSMPLRKAINHILRAMRIGGNLSETMNDIASDVSDEMKNKIGIFAQKMNFFSVIFIFLGIVLPVAIMILGAIRNSPLASTGEDLFKNIPLTPQVLFLIYIIGMPILFGMMIFMVYNAQPKM
jgi:pilus assembly protein TadC